MAQNSQVTNSICKALQIGELCEAYTLLPLYVFILLLVVLVVISRIREDVFTMNVFALLNAIVEKFKDRFRKQELTYLVLTKGLTHKEVSNFKKAFIRKRRFLNLSSGTAPRIIGDKVVPVFLSKFMFSRVTSELMKSGGIEVTFPSPYEKGEFTKCTIEGILNGEQMPSLQVKAQTVMQEDISIPESMLCRGSLIEGYEAHYKYANKIITDPDQKQIFVYIDKKYGYTYMQTNVKLPKYNYPFKIECTSTQVPIDLLGCMLLLDDEDSYLFELMYVNNSRVLLEKINEILSDVVFIVVSEFKNDFKKLTNQVNFFPLPFERLPITRAEIQPKGEEMFMDILRDRLKPHLSDD